MGPLTKKITANWVAETMEAKQRVADIEDDMMPAEKYAKCDLVEGYCLCYESCVCPVDDGESAAVDLSVLSGDETDTATAITRAATEDKAISNHKRHQKITAEAKRRATIERSINAWGELIAEVNIKSFEKALPKYPIVAV
ncbi:Hypothetical protein PHPALM_14389 [Phytophthora palmivora]|uniref:Uncharacterized protein n=1 Tax=Phytophthora palmivora TaxID=4796 RepID=A0A2P4XUY0_9STRA|nr:Hypothetical protein PHPALM_14389 [Phytophthora palmivora]